MRKIFFLTMAAVCSLMVVKAADVTAADGYAGLKSVLNAATSGDVIRVEVGIYTADDEELVIDPGVEVIGGYTDDTFTNRIYPGAAVSKDEMTILDGNSLMTLPADKHRVATVKGTLEGVVIRNGHVRNDNGGGVLIDGGLVLNCIIKGNVALTVDGATPSLGGGAYLQGGGKIVNCVVAFNMANNGYGVAGTGEVVNNTITANTYAPETIKVAGNTYQHYLLHLEAASLPTWYKDTPVYDAQTITISEFRIAATETTTSQYAVFAAAMDLTYNNAEITFEKNSIGALTDPTGGGVAVTTRMGFTATGKEILFKEVSDYGLRKIDQDFIYYDNRANEAMVCVSWFGALAYSVWIGGTLPTEGQWELAARSNGTNTLDTYMFAGSDAYIDHTVIATRAEQVANRKPNNIGIFDMTGGVYDWVADGRGATATTTYPDYTSQSTPYNTLTDPIWNATVNYRMGRGGSSASTSGLGVISLPFRYAVSAGSCGSTMGFRPVLVP